MAASSGGTRDQVLQLLTEGKSNTEIAELLIVTRSTVNTYRKRITTKLCNDFHTQYSHGDADARSQPG